MKSQESSRYLVQGYPLCDPRFDCFSALVGATAGTLALFGSRVSSLFDTQAPGELMTAEMAVDR